jgi:DNA-directed RNA polymerase subunit RPC12/RpoP
MKKVLLIMAVLLSVQLSAKTSSKTKRAQLNDTVVEFFINGIDTVGKVSFPNYRSIYFNIYRWSPEYKVVFPKNEKQIRAFVEFIKEEYDCYYEDLIKSSGTECEECCERVYVKTRKPIIAKKIKPWRKNFIMYGFIYE